MVIISWLVAAGFVLNHRVAMPWTGRVAWVGGNTRPGHRRVAWLPQDFFNHRVAVPWTGRMAWAGRNTKHGHRRWPDRRRIF